MHFNLYIDVLFAINFFMNSVVLLILGHILKGRRKLPWVALSAGIGSILACLLTIMPNMGLYNILLGYVMIGIIMVFLVFRYQGILVLCKNCLCLYGVAGITGGIISILYQSEIAGKIKRYLLKKQGTVSVTGWSLLLFAIVTGFLLKKLLPVFLNRIGYDGTIYDIEIICENVRCTASGLLDTGNHLTVLQGEKPVIIAEYEAIKPILKQVTDIYRYRAIPFRSIGKENGMMSGIICDQVIIKDGKRTILNENITVAIYRGKLSSDGKYQVILHSALF